MTSGSLKRTLVMPHCSFSIWSNTIEPKMVCKVSFGRTKFYNIFPHFPFGRKQRGVGSRKPFGKWENRPDVLENREGKVRNRTKRKSQWLMLHTHKIQLFIRKNCDFVCIQRNSLYICNHKTKQETNRTMFLNKNTYWWWRNSRPEKSWGDSLICISNHIPMWRHGGLSYLRQVSFFIPFSPRTNKRTKI